MITVSATAVGVWFKFPMPGLNDLYPNSVGWVVAVAAVGGVIAIVAAFGYKMVASSRSAGSARAGEASRVKVFGPNLTPGYLKL